MKNMIFSAESVWAFLAGRKSMARRVIRWPKDWQGFECDHVIPLKNNAGYSFWAKDSSSFSMVCPYKVGEVIYVKEAWATIKLHNNKAPFAIDRYTNPPLWYKADDPAPSETSCNPWPEGNIGKWRSPLSMPEWAARLFCEISGTRVERVQEMMLPDVYAEGLFNWNDFFVLWDSLNAKRGFGWDKNPWVWVYKLKEVPKSPDT